MAKVHLVFEQCEQRLLQAGQVLPTPVVVAIATAPSNRPTYVGDVASNHNLLVPSSYESTPAAGAKLGGPYGGVMMEPGPIGPSLGTTPAPLVSPTR